LYQAAAGPVSQLFSPDSSAQDGFKKSTKNIFRADLFYGNQKYALKSSQ